MLKQLQLFALGLEPSDISDWTPVSPVEGLVVPTIAWRLGEAAPPSLKGLRRYTWTRYQVLYRKAQELQRIFNLPAFLADDLNLAGRGYPDPSARSMEGLDFYLREKDLEKAEKRLREYGWNRPSWEPVVGSVELRKEEDPELRLRLWHSLYPGLHYQPELPWSDRSEELIHLPLGEQFWRTCWIKREPLWLIDSWFLLERGAGRDPSFLSPYLKGWERTARRQVGSAYRFPAAAREDWSFWDLLLSVSCGRESPLWNRLEELSTAIRDDLACGKDPGHRLRTLLRKSRV
ncbi:MAG: hypothetical protein KC800_09460 [Candidatus Eremiobacteraeota bacterium]|nr:hypothetical protein [Candidatus Eremiobacteraeota bacterium]